jgi:L-iditol 2-dehydrogenase
VIVAAPYDLAVKVARLTSIGHIELMDEPDPVPTEGQTLVRVGAVGLCGSDLHWFGQGGIGDAQLDAPLVLGHEMAGIAETGPLAGRRVAIDPAIPCGTCRACRDGNPNLCPTVVFAGHGHTDGGLRELMAWPTERLHPLPDRLSDAEGALLEPTGVAIHALDLAHLRSGMTVAVIGCGPIGLLAVQLARRAGAEQVLAIDPLAHRRVVAGALGADLVGTPGEAVDLAAELGDGKGIDVAIEIAGNDAAVACALEVVRPGARVVLAGIPDDDRTTFSASTARRKGLTLLLVRRMKDVYPRAITASADISLASLVSARYPLSRTAAAFETAVHRSGLKVIVEP